MHSRRFSSSHVHAADTPTAPVCTQRAQARSRVPLLLPSGPWPSPCVLDPLAPHLLSAAMPSYSPHVAPVSHARLSWPHPYVLVSAPATSSRPLVFPLYQRQLCCHWLVAVSAQQPILPSALACRAYKPKPCPCRPCSSHIPHVDKEAIELAIKSHEQGDVKGRREE